MTEKIIISKELNEWLGKHQTLDTDDTIYSKRFGKEIFDKLFKEVEVSDTEKYINILAVFGLSGHTKVVHLWLLLNRDKWEVAKDELFYICIPEPDGIDFWLTKGEGMGFRAFPPYNDNYKWTQEEIDKHEVAKHLQHFKKKVEELIKKLEKFDEDMEVFHEYDGTFSVGRIEGVYVEENYCYEDNIQEIVILN